MCIISLMLASCTVATPTIQPTTTIAASDTPIPTATVTQIPTPTATLSFPLLAGTPMPLSKVVINETNISSLRETLDWYDTPSGTFVISPDKSLAIVSTSEWIRIYKTSPKELVKQLDGFGIVKAISADNQRLLTEVGSIYSIDGEMLFQINSEGPISYSADWSRVAIVKGCSYTGAVFAACESDVYDVATNKMINGFPGDTPLLSPDGKIVALRQVNFIYFNSVDKGNTILQLNPDNYLMDDPTWKYSDDSKKILIIHPPYSAGRSQKPSVDILSLEDGSLIRTIYSEMSAINDAAISPNGQLLAMIGDGNVVVYDIQAKTILSTSPLDGNKDFYGVGDNGTPIYVDKPETIFQLDKGIQNVYGLHFGEDANTLIFTTSDQYCTLHNNTNVDCTTRGDFLANDGYFYSVSADAENIILSKLEDGGLHEAARMNWKYIAYNNITSVKIIGYSAGKPFLALQFDIGAMSQRFVIFDLNKQEIVKSWDWDESYASYHKMSLDGRYLAVAVSGTTYGDGKPKYYEGIFDFEKGWFVWSGGNSDTYLISISPDSTKIAEIQSRNGHSLLYYYDFIRQELKAYYEMTTCYIDAAQISPDNSFILLGCGSSIMAMDLATGKEITRWDAFNGGVSSIAFSPDGTRIAAANYQGFIKAWDLGD